MTPSPEKTARDDHGVGRRRSKGAVFALFLVVVLIVWRSGSAPAGDVQDFLGTTMGTSFRVKIDAAMSRSEHEAVQGEIEERFALVDGLMSTFDPASEVSRFNRYLSTEPFAVSAELLEVLTTARDVSERSDGAFDVTVAPLVDAWGFGPGGPAVPAPDDVRLAALRDRVGYRRIVLDPSTGTVSKTNPETRIDLSGIAKGYAAEQVASRLLGMGYSSFLVEVGGELKAAGTRDGSPWRVGVEALDEAAPALVGTLELDDDGIATSGDYRNFYEDRGVRYAHIIDPRNGQPIRVRGASVTVVHANAAAADAWATALTVLGPEAGFDVARREGLAALFVWRANGKLRLRATPGLAGRLSPSEESEESEESERP